MAEHRQISRCAAKLVTAVDAEEQQLSAVRMREACFAGHCGSVPLQRREDQYQSCSLEKLERLDSRPDEDEARAVYGKLLMV